GPIGPAIVEHGPVLISAHVSGAARPRHPAAPLNGSRLSLRSAGMTRWRCCVPFLPILEEPKAASVFGAGSGRLRRGSVLPAQEVGAFGRGAHAEEGHGLVDLGAEHG